MAKIYLGCGMLTLSVFHDAHVQTFIASGIRALDMQLRFKYADISINSGRGYYKGNRTSCDQEERKFVRIMQLYCIV